ncbi:hypothetical protein ASPSYDRAFT_31713 [Aspergillus sydowii CBS 593.65]|uniref:Uncharacterized protein n=1 Tax=Aspergillus sydowii CBS 593.65 TaxID=1036612 RepID=A0A1L9TI48_9EURO|nr:uncharacterized protein ASPSYDRAFT_31713 [Aspergillus sydowii CBS 593.65]OJJ59095.1 hypothetical protein ASPSYDRAFT_31713 [Aspergillus sydowii CBS 593.65]
MGNSSSQLEARASHEHDVLLTDYDIPPPLYQNASAGRVLDEKAPPAAADSPETPEPSNPLNPSIVQTIRNHIINTAKSCGTALKELSENKFVRPFVVTGIIVTRLLILMTYVVGYPIYVISYWPLYLLLVFAQRIYPEGFEDEHGAAARFVSWAQGVPCPCQICDGER